jgi:hypothetical protein
MSLVNDVILTENEWIDLIINGSVTYSVTGLQERLSDFFPDKDIVVEFANPDDINYGRELVKPYVALSCRFKYPKKALYWKDQIPKSEDIGWSEGLSIRFDVWGRTPPETRDIADATVGKLIVLKRQLWTQTRAALDVQMEVENYVDTLEGVPDLFHRSINAVLTVFKTEEVD